MSKLAKVDWLVVNDTPNRYSRTLNDAFGPYCNTHIEPMPEPKRRLWQDVAVYLAFVAAMILAAIVGQS